MPIVKPSDKESYEDFMLRCVDNDDMKDAFADKTVRADQCHISWEGGRMEKLNIAKDMAKKSINGFRNKK